MLTDLRQAFRQLLQHRGFTALAVSALALGIGANTAIFSAIDTLFLRSLPYPESSRLVRIWGAFPEKGLEQANLSYPRYLAIRDAQQVFTELSAQSFTGFTLTGRGDPEQVQAQRVSDRFFPLLGVKPLLGRTFLPEEDKPGGPPVVLLSHAWWQTRFGGDPAIVGRSITLNGTPHTVIGVLPASFAFPFAQTQAWAARVFDTEGLPPDLVNRGTGYLTVMGRLKPGFTLAQVNEQLKTIAARYRAAEPDNVDAKAPMFSVSFQEDLVGRSRPAFLVLLAAVGFLLLIACANVANLLLVRFTGRRKEIALRAALGATRGRIIRQFLLESLLTTTIAGAVGIFLAQSCIGALATIGANFIPRAAELTLDGPVVGFAILLTFLTGLLLGLVPAWQASSPDVNEALKDSSRGSTGGRATSRFRSALFVGEVALSLVLLVGAGLLAGSFLRLQRVPTGFNSDGVAVVNVGISPGQYPEISNQAVFYEQLLNRLAAIPGVTRAAGTDSPPSAGGFARSPFALEGTSVAPVNERPIAVRSLLTPGFFATLGIPLRQGRDFTWRDRDGATNVVIINEIMARRLFPHGENPLGHRLITGIQSIPREIVGVVGDVRSQGLDSAPQEEMYYPTAQLGDLFLSVVLQSPRPATSLRAEITAALRAIDATIPPPDVQSYADLLRDSISDRKLVMGLVGAFAALALFLAGLGIYSVIAYNVAQRTNEFGVRLALGAEPAALVRLVLRDGLRLTGLGLGVGLAASLALSRLLQALLFDLRADDPVVFGTVTLFLVGVAALACWFPARRATRIDPMAALRSD